ncbi:metal ABC transporter solute-binding protein, Zn/Mn family [Propionibacteriaceae bacterium G1746]
MSVTLTRRGLLGLAATLTASATVLSACGTTTSSSGDKLSVVASTIVWGSIAEAVGGDLVKVTSVVKSPDQDPHDYEATAQDKLTMSTAKVAVVNGGGYDAWATQLAGSAEKKPSLVDAFALSGLAEGANEHVFYDLALAVTVANKLAETFGQADTANATTYTENAKAFTDKIAAITKRAKDWSATHPGTKVVSTESVAEYLLKDLSLDDVTPADYIRQSESEAGPSVAVVEKTRQLIGTEAKVLVVNGQTEDAISKSLVDRATATGARVVKVYETFPEGVSDYVTFVGDAINALTAEK